ncbi:MAG TPA: hypothetical protein GXZ23_01050 [Clostridiales bacterium]|nr:hypothetical protein [Clostridiales bacterium]
MYYFDQLPATLKNHFENMEGFGNYEFLTEFPGTLRKTPLTRLTVSFGLNKVNITQPLSEDGVPVYDSYHESATSVRFIIHAPVLSAGTAFISPLPEFQIFCLTILIWILTRLTAARFLTTEIPIPFA